MLPTINLSNDTAPKAKRLVAHRDVMYPKAWVLSWSLGNHTSIGTEGECSRRYFHTARAARAYGERTYSERAAIIGNWRGDE